jgi:ubiquinone/menaquinone biosynthesis C-methylase UbiE
MKSVKSSTEPQVLQGSELNEEKEWPIRLFKRSVLKQRKYLEICSFLGEVEGKHCLDIGSDNGVISYLLRSQGGTWKSADLDEGSVSAIRELVGSDVYQIDGGPTPFKDSEFDKVVIVDFLEHIPQDGAFLDELYRVLKPGGVLIVNVPYYKDSLLRRFRHKIGQTDVKHGHLRPGYTVDTLTTLFGSKFELQKYKTYSKFFSELVDTLVVWGVSLLRKGKEEPSKKGLIVTGKDLKKYQSGFRLYSAIYPFVWLVSKLDNLLFFRSGYMLIVKSRVLRGR